MKSGSNYRMSAQTKRGLALGRFKNDHDRGEWKRSMIQAELAEATQPRSIRDRKNDKGAE